LSTNFGNFLDGEEIEDFILEVLVVSGSSISGKCQQSECQAAGDGGVSIFSAHTAHLPQESGARSFLFVYTDLIKWNGSSQAHSFVQKSCKKPDSQNDSLVNFETQIPNRDFFHSNTFGDTQDRS
jgi:hypothetical protein